MDDDSETPPSLRGLAGLALVYGVALGGLFALLPWKTPWLNAIGVAYGALYVVAAPGLWLRAAFGRALARWAAIAGLVLGALCLGGIAASLGHLRGTFGALGVAPAVIVGLATLTVLQAFALVPVLVLRTLRRGGARRRGAALLGLAVIAIGAGAQARVELHPLPALPEPSRTAAVTAVRAALGGPPGDARALAGVPLGAGPLFVTLWSGGKAVARVAVGGRDLAEAARDAGRALAAQLEGRAPTGVLRFDRVVASAPVTPWLLALSVVPGLDGVAAAGDPARAVLPDDLLAAGALADSPVIPGYGELLFGVAPAALAAIGPPPWVRLRVESWLEQGAGAVTVSRGNAPGPAPSLAAFERAAIAAGDHLLGLQAPDGRFAYRYLPQTDTFAPGESLARQAGSAYGLALLARHTGQARFQAGARRSLAYLLGRLTAPCGAEGRACLALADRADVCTNSLLVIASLEARRGDGDRGRDDLVRRIVAFLTSLQRPDGDFHHVFAPASGVVPGPRRQFCTEEASLALLLAHEAFGEPALLTAAERALDYATVTKYDFFLGWFTFGADSWTCIAADEAFGRLSHARYVDFCLGYAAFLGRLQYRPGEAPADFTGHYGLGSLLVPSAGPTATAAETLASTLSLARKQGRPAAAVRDQLAAALAALLRDQLRADNTWMFPVPARLVGGFRRSLVEPELRIDFAQHALSGLVRGGALLARE